MFPLAKRDLRELDPLLRCLGYGVELSHSPKLRGQSYAKIAINNKQARKRTRSQAFPILP